MGVLACQGNLGWKIPVVKFGFAERFSIWFERFFGRMVIKKGSLAETLLFSGGPCGD